MSNTAGKPKVLCFLSTCQGKELCPCAQSSHLPVYPQEDCRHFIEGTWGLVNNQYLAQQLRQLLRLLKFPQRLVGGGMTQEPSSEPSPSQNNELCGERGGRHTQPSGLRRMALLKLSSHLCLSVNPVANICFGFPVLLRTSKAWTV